MNDKKLRYGLIGCGAIARIKHMAAVALYPDEVEMAAFCDVIEERAVEYAKEYGTPDAKVYTDYKELLKDETIDAVIVATPNRSHSFITIDSLEAGKHVLCEKPMAKTYEEAKAMVETAKRTGKILTIGYQNRYREDVSYAKATCEEDELGEVLDRLKSINSENCTYDTFSGKADNMNSNVKFIIETDAIETEE